MVFFGFRADRAAMIVYGLLAGLFALTFLFGNWGIASARPLFIVGCPLVAWRAFRVGPGLHVEIVIFLFAFTPFFRRVVDLNSGFEISGSMLIGPLLALIIPLPALKRVFIQNTNMRGVYAPYLIMGACLTYAWALSVFQGDLIEATINGSKIAIPMLYAVYLIQNGRYGEQVLTGAMRGFLKTVPIICTYGIYQYLSPPEWDRYWMLNSPLLNSIGLPEPRKVRVFGTMNSPASFAMFTGCGILFYGFCKRGWLSILLTAPVLVGLLLSLYRTAWISITISVAYYILFDQTRRKAINLVLILITLGSAAVLLTSFGDDISKRLMTLTGDPAQDGSGHERLLEYMHLYSDQDRYLFGNGLGRNRIADPAMTAIDGQPIASAVVMGIVIGNIYLLALLWACLQGVFSLDRGAPVRWILAAGIVVGNVAIFPLAIISTGETGFPVWTFAALLTARKLIKRNEAGAGSRERFLPNSSVFTRRDYERLS